MRSEVQTNTSGLLPWLICGLAGLFYVYDYFIQVSPSVMTQQLMEYFSIGAGGLGILSACFFYAYIIMQIPAGLLLDRFGARNLLTAAVFISACGVTLFAITPYLAVAGFARFLIGLGSAFAFVSALFLISRWFHHRHFAMLAGLIQLGGCLGSIFGLAPLAVAINHFGWQESMFWAGMLTFMLTGIYWLVIRDGEARQGKSLVPKGEWQRLQQVLRTPQLWWIGVCGFMCWIPVGVIGALWGVPYLMEVYQWSNTTAGNWCSLFWVGLGFGSPLIGWLSARWQRRCLPIQLCFVVGLFSTTLLLNANHLPATVTGFSLLLLGVSCSVQSMSFGLVKDIVPEEIFGTASGFNNMAAILGSGLTQPLVGFFLSLTWGGVMMHHAPVYNINDYRLAFLVLPLAALIGIVVSSTQLQETKCRPVNN